MRRFLFAVLFLAATAPAARATPQMPIDLVGDWCFESQEGRTVWFLLPSWTEPGACLQVLSVRAYDFFGAGHHCEPVRTELSAEEAPSGVAHLATVTARCQPDGPIGPGEVRTIEFLRYKGSLKVTPR